MNKDIRSECELIERRCRSSYARALIEVRADVELKDNIVDECPKNIDSDMVSKKNNANTSGNKKKDVEPTIKVSNSNSFDVLNSVEAMLIWVQNEGTSNLASKKANSSVTLADDDGKPLTNVDFSGDHDSEDEKENYENGDYDFDPYDDDMYEGQDIPDKIQAICDNLDIKVINGRRCGTHPHPINGRRCGTQSYIQVIIVSFVV
ncbi:hypothetical protein Tco_1301227 [Tanacetum coccineum]